MLGAVCASKQVKLNRSISGVSPLIFAPFLDETQSELPFEWRRRRPHTELPSPRIQGQDVKMLPHIMTRLSCYVVTG